MDDMEWHTGETWATSAMYERMYDYTSKRRASCSVVRSCHVRVGHGAHAIVRNVLKVVEVVREDVRSLP